MTQPDKSYRRRVLLGTVWSASSEWARWGISAVVLLIIAARIGPEGFGLVAMAGVFTALGYALVGRQLLDSLVQFADLEPGHVSAMFWAVLVLGCVIAAFLALIAAPAAALFDEPLVRPLILVHTAAIVAAALSTVPAALLRRRLQVHRVAQASLVNAVVGGVCGLGLAFAGAGVWSVAGMQIGGTLAEGLTLWVAAPWRPGRTTWRHFRDLSHFNVSVLGTYLLAYLNYQGPRFLISLGLGAVAVGQFTLARRFIELLGGLVTRPMQEVAFPALARINGDEARFRAHYTTGARFAALVVYPSYLGFGLIAPALIGQFFDESWAPVAGLVPILALASLRIPVFAMNDAMMRALGFPHFQSLHLLASSVLGVGLIGAALMLEIGLTGVVCAVVLRDALLWPLNLALAWRAGGIGATAQLRPCLTPFLATCFMVGVVLAWQFWMGAAGSPVILISSSVLIGCCAYVAAIFVLDRNLVREVIKFVAGTRMAKV